MSHRGRVCTVWMRCQKIRQIYYRDRYYCTNVCNNSIVQQNPLKKKRRFFLFISLTGAYLWKLPGRFAKNQVIEELVEYVRHSMLQFSLSVSGYKSFRWFRLSGRTARGQTVESRAGTSIYFSEDRRFLLNRRRKRHRHHVVLAGPRWTRTTVDGRTLLSFVPRPPARFFPRKTYTVNWFDFFVAR